jgi:metal-responsive CopG/Arc/MetJ family transcriptional regulator
METIRITLDRDLLRRANRAAKKLKTNRSALFREALREHLKRIDLRQREMRDREGYLRYPDSLDDPTVWDKVHDWPENQSGARSPDSIDS